MDLTSCEDVLEAPKSLTLRGGKYQTGPGENPERHIPNHGKGTDDPKHRDMTDISTGQQPASSGQETAHKSSLVNFWDSW